MSEKKKVPVYTNDESEVNGIFRIKKEKAVKLSESYFRIGKYNKALNVRECGTSLTFRHEIDSSGNVNEKGKLYRANFCKDRLCPMCNWRRSFKYFAQISKIMDVVQDKYKFLFLTLTIRNPDGDHLLESLNRLQYAWTKFNKLKDFKQVVRGYIRTLEVTYNDDVSSPSYDTYHPHYHVILAVPKCYGSRGRYLERSEWLRMWQDCYGDSEISQLTIEVIRKKNGSSVDYNEFQTMYDLRAAVCETAKYAVKDSDYLKDSTYLTDKLVSIFSDVLHSRRLILFGGVFKKVRAELLLDDPDDGDLINVNDQINASLAHVITRYEWQIGVYKLIDRYMSLYEH